MRTATAKARPEAPAANPPSFDELAALEPRLKYLLLEVALHAAWEASGPGWCRRPLWRGFGPFYRGGVRDRLIKIVGHGRRGDGPAVLFGTAAFHVACDRVAAVLPACTASGCCQSPQGGRLE